MCCVESTERWEYENHGFQGCNASVMLGTISSPAHATWKSHKHAWIRFQWSTSTAQKEGSEKQLQFMVEMWPKSLGLYLV